MFERLALEERLKIQEQGGWKELFSWVQLRVDASPVFKAYFGIDCEPRSYKALAEDPEFNPHKNVSQKNHLSALPSRVVEALKQNERERIWYGIL